MSANNTFLAVFLGSKTSPKWAAWTALTETERQKRQQEGMAAWKSWVEKHQAVIVAMGALCLALRPRRGGRVVECTALEIRWRRSPRVCRYPSKS